MYLDSLREQAKKLEIWDLIMKEPMPLPQKDIKKTKIELAKELQEK